MRQLKPQELADLLQSTIIKETLIDSGGEKVTLWGATDKEVELKEYEDFKLFILVNEVTTRASTVFVSINRKLIKDTTRDEFHKWTPKLKKEEKSEEKV